MTLVGIPISDRPVLVALVAHNKDDQFSTTDAYYLTRYPRGVLTCLVMDNNSRKSFSLLIKMSA
ncbi:uncharacterized protein PHALS_05931 [Plasmopara halstedii]|uniref:Uncharacterized protein n=1 Tax=Plasmopara halstedii TaxID=4781 RepID=A0A0P1AC38_PLAHL|nr:uncharacterized protein PHALS_05931 [Plasmopara halstedii]CEG37881.1 hypothetical protein PHALS_05931 [Plasmopara halstedii]|eukprot:XP_024574250.1 hypothetical protein PHALS_05931 [Plasmopara halstedii]